MTVYILIVGEFEDATVQAVYLREDKATAEKQRLEALGLKAEVQAEEVVE